LTPQAMLQRILFFGLLALVSGPAPAIDFYDVEILVFRQLDSQGDDEELDVPNIRHLELNLALHDLLDQTSPIPLDPAIEGYLSNAGQRIGNSRDYETLFHGRWSQTTSDRKTAPYIRIDLPAVGRSPSLIGVLRLFSTDLLYVDAFLRYRPAEQQANKRIVKSTERNKQPYYFLKERRRVKFREIHFLDHPKFGILLTVLPVKLPELPVPTNEPQPDIKSDPVNTPSISPSSSDF
jgi:hypothetical protein